jgi:hypothetical protein
MNNYLKILSHLKAYEGDEQYHDIGEILVGMNKATMNKVFIELKKEGLIKLTGGPAPIYSTGLTNRDGYGSREVRWHSTKIGTDRPYKGKITFKGSKYLKDELQLIDINKMNIRIGDNSTANMILHSPNSTILNKPHSRDTINKIIEVLKNDTTQDASTISFAISTFSLLRAEVDLGNPTQDTWNKAFTIGANIASVGSLVLALVQQFTK